MRITALLAASALLLLSGSCKTTQTPPPEVAPDKEAKKPEPGAAAAADNAGGQSAPTSDIRDQVILTYTMSSLDNVLDRGLGYVRPHLPPAFAAMLRPSMLKAQLFKSMKMPQLETVVDATRPLALAIADPEQYRGGGRLGSTMLSVPVSDAQGLADALGQVADGHERRPWGDHVFDFHGDKVRLRLVDGNGLLASDEKLLGGAEGVLAPALQAQAASKSAARLRIDLATINRLYGAQIDRGLRRMKRKMDRQQGAGVAKMVSRWIGYFKSAEEALVELQLEPALIRAIASLSAASSGELPTLLGKMRPGPAWGARYLPADSGLVYLSNQSPDAMAESIDEGLELLQGMVQGVVPAATMTRLQELAKKGVQHFSGESAGAMWVNADGSIGGCSIARVKDAAAAQASTVQLLQLLSAELRRLFTKGLPAKVRQELKGASLGLRVRPGALRVAGVRGALVELEIKWPRLKDADARKRMGELRRKLGKVLGPRGLTLALAGTGDLLMMVVGKDHRKRLANLLATAKGGKGSSMEQTVAGIVGSRRIVALVYAPIATLAEQVMRLTEQLTTVPAQVKDVFQKVLPPPGKTVPISAVVQATGPKLTVEIEASPELVGMITRGVVSGMSTFGGGAPFPPPQP